MYLRNLVFAALLLITAVTTDAATKSCDKFVSVFESPTSNCQCGDIGNTLGIKSPYVKMKLVAVCGFSEEKYDHGKTQMLGSFFLQGEQIFSGVLRRKDSDFVTEFTFIGEELLPTPPFSDSVVDLRFEDDKLAQRIFRAPPLTQNKPCVEANIKLRVNKILIFPGDWDQSGSYARDYKALEIGPYRRCRRN